MELLTSCIQADEGLKYKHPEMLLTPLFNFMDQRSLLSWLDMRSLFLNTGARYRLRLEIHMGFFVLTTFALHLICVYKLIFRGETPLNDKLSAILLVYAFIFTYSVFQALYNGAFVNIQTEKQIYQFTELKLFLKQLTNDFDFIFSSQETKNSIQSKIF